MKSNLHQSMCKISFSLMESSRRVKTMCRARYRIPKTTNWRYVNFHLLFFRPISFFYQLFKLTSFYKSTTRASFSHLLTPQNSFFFIKIAANCRLKVSEHTHVSCCRAILCITTSGFTITFLDYFPLIFFSQKWLILRKRIKKLKF